MKKLRAQPRTAAITGALASGFLLACQVTGTVESEDGEGARARQEAMVEALRRDPGSEHPETLIAIARLIELRTASGDVDGGRPLFEEILAIPPLARMVLERHITRKEPTIEIAGILGGLGELAAAQSQLEDVLSRYRWLLGRENYVCLALQEALARLLFAREDTPAAIAVLEQLAEISEQSLGREHADTVRVRENLARELRHAGVRTSRDLPSDYREVLNAMGRPSPRQNEQEDFIVDLGPSGSFPRDDEELDHQPVDRMLDHPNVDAAFEVLERYRTTGLLSEGEGGTSVLARLRLAGGESGVRAAGGPALRKIGARLNAITRALDRLDETGGRQAALLAERARLQRRRHERLGQLYIDATSELYRPMTSNDARASLDPATVLLSYAVGREHTDLFVITPGAPTAWHRLPVSRETLRERVDGFSGSLGLAQRGARPLRPIAGLPREEVARWLFDTLVAPAGDRIAPARRVLIVPDGPLYRLPFAALMRPAEGGRPQYLGEWKPLHLVQSASMYAELRGRRPAEAKRRGHRGLVALGDPVYPGGGGGASSPAASRGSRCAVPAARSRTLRRPLPLAVRSAVRRGHTAGLDPLPCTAREVQAIGRLFAEASEPQRTFLAEDATEETSKQSLAQASYVHLAVHGFADPEQPDHSYLALSLPQDLSEERENGILEVWEIVDQLQLDADLVTLAACVTALGPERGGEGLMSLSHAFQVAGARSVLASLWRVDDESTSELMTRFYRHLLSGTPKDEALRAAQSELIRGPIQVQGSAGGVEMRDFTDPYYWAAFQLIGDWQ